MTLGNYTQFNMLGMGSSMGYQNFLGGGFGMGMGNFNIGSMLGGCNMLQNCDGSYNYDAMAGMAVGNVLVNCLTGFIGQSIAAKQAKKAEASENSVESLTKKVAEQQAVVDAKDSAVKAAQAKVDEVTNTTLPKLRDELSTLENDADYLQWVADYKTETDEAKLKGLKLKIDAHEAKIEAEKKKIAAAEESIKETGTLGKALKEAKEAHETENAKLTTLKDELNKAEKVKQEAENQKTLSKADGNMFTRSSSKRMTEKHKVVEENGTLKSYNIDTSDISDGDIAYALSKFQAMTKDEGKTKWAEMYQELYLKSGDSVPTKTQNKAYEEIIKPWLAAHKA